MGSNAEPSLTLTKLMPAFESRRVRTQPRISTFEPAGTEPARAFFTLTTCMALSLAPSRGSELAALEAKDKSLQRVRPPSGGPRPHGSGPGARFPGDPRPAAAARPCCPPGPPA